MYLLNPPLSPKASTSAGLVDWGFSALFEQLRQYMEFDIREGKWHGGDEVWEVRKWRSEIDGMDTGKPGHGAVI